MTGFRLLRYFSTVLSLIKAGHCIFTHSRPDKIRTPKVASTSRSNTMPHLLSINESASGGLMLLKPALHIAEFKFIKGISYAKC